MERVYILLMEDGSKFKFDTDGLPEDQRPSLVNRFIVENVLPLTEEEGKERYHYLVDEGKGIFVKMKFKRGHSVYMSIPWDPKEDTREGTRELLDNFEEIEDFVVNKLGEE